MHARLVEFLERLFADKPRERVEEWLTPEEYISLYTVAFEACVLRDVDSSSKSQSSDSKANGSLAKAASSSAATGTIIQGQSLYTGLCSFFKKKFFPSCKARILNSSSLLKGIDSYLAEWERYSSSILRVEAVFHYLDRFWIVREIEDRKINLNSEDPVLHIYPLLVNLWDTHLLHGTIEESIIFPFIQSVCYQFIKDWDLKKSCNNQEFPPSTVMNSGSELKIFQSDGNGFVDAESSLSNNHLDIRLLKIAKGYHSMSFVSPESMIYKTKTISMASNPLCQRFVPQFCAYLGSRVKDATVSILNPNQPLTILMIWEREEQLARSLFIEGLGKVASGTGGTFAMKAVFESLKSDLLLPLMVKISERIADSLADDEDPVPTSAIIYRLVAKRKSLLSQLAMAGVKTGFMARLKRLLPSLSPVDVNNVQLDQVNLITDYDDSVLRESISRVYLLWKECRRIISESLGSDLLMFDACDSAFSEHLRSNAELFHPHGVALWVVKCLTDNGTLETTDVDFFLASLRYLRDLDARLKFMNAFERLISSQLIFGYFMKPKKIDFAQGIEILLTKMTLTYGSGFVSHCRRMVSDIQLSEGLYKLFVSKTKTKASVQNARVSTIGVFTMGSWPLSSIQDLNAFDCGVSSSEKGQSQTFEREWIDESVASLLFSFEKYYKDLHGGRRLRWSPLLTSLVMAVHKSSHGTDVSSETLESAASELIVSAAQYSVLNALRKNKSLNLSELSESTGLSISILRADNSSLKTLLSYDLVKATVITSKYSGLNDWETPKIGNECTRNSIHFSLNLKKLNNLESWLDISEVHVARLSKRRSPSRGSQGTFFTGIETNLDQMELNNESVDLFGEENSSLHNFGSKSDKSVYSAPRDYVEDRSFSEQAKIVRILKAIPGQTPISLGELCRLMEQSLTKRSAVKRSSAQYISGTGSPPTPIVEDSPGSFNSESEYHQEILKLARTLASKEYVKLSEREPIQLSYIP